MSMEEMHFGKKEIIETLDKFTRDGNHEIRGEIMREIRE
jgi:hypothetical protein